MIKIIELLSTLSTTCIVVPVSSSVSNMIHDVVVCGDKNQQLQETPNSISISIHLCIVQMINLNLKKCVGVVMMGGGMLMPIILIILISMLLSRKQVWVMLVLMIPGREASGFRLRTRSKKKDEWGERRKTKKNEEQWWSGWLLSCYHMAVTGDEFLIFELITMSQSSHIDYKGQESNLLTPSVIQNGHEFLHYYYIDQQQE